MNLSVFIAHALKELGYFQIKNAAYITQIITQTNIFFSYTKLKCKFISTYKNIISCGKSNSIYQKVKKYV